ncbi:MAG: IS701 family transposase [Labilithrix sp.]|nr:IS701 family transposase [Labilithrix sp.]
MQRVSHASGWEKRFDRFVQPFLDAWRHKKRRQWAPIYLRGLLLPGERKSIEPLAARVAPGHDQELRHFISESAWDQAEIEEVLWEKADAMLGGDDAFLIIDDTALPKKGVESVGVAHQYCGALGKQANCQSLVSATLAKDDVPVPVALRLYLPEAWANDKKRRARVDVPDAIEFQPKWRIALDEVRRLKKAGVRFGTVLADAGYGVCADFRRGLSEEKLFWAVGIISEQKLYPVNAHTRMPRPGPAGGRPRVRGLPTHARRTAKELVAQRGEKAWRRISWRDGTKGPLEAEFIAVRVRVADGPKTTNGVHLPGDEAWLVGERRHTGEVKYHLTNHPPNAALKTLASAIKARWSCEQAHQQLKEELGLDHFEGRTWRGLHHHALMTLICFAFLQQERLRENKPAA